MNTRSLAPICAALVSLVCVPIVAQEADLAVGAEAEELYQRAIATEDLDLRVDLLSQCLELDPDHPEAGFGLADALYQRDDLEGWTAALAAALFILGGLAAATRLPRRPAAARESAPQ